MLNKHDYIKQIKSHLVLFDKYRNKLFQFRSNWKIFLTFILFTLFLRNKIKVKKKYKFKIKKLYTIKGRKKEKNKKCLS